MDDAIISHIRQRLKRCGYDWREASIEFIRIKSADSSVRRDAFGEFYYLNSKAVPGTLTIESNIHSFNLSDAAGYAGFNEYRFHEFSGIIFISAAVPIDLEFIRVIPEPMEKINHNFKNNSIRTLVRQASRWAVASQQDKNPMIAILHANYAAGYLWALKDIATDQEIENAAGIHVLKFRDEIIKTQDSAMAKISKPNQ